MQYRQIEYQLKCRFIFQTVTCLKTTLLEPTNIHRKETKTPIFLTNLSKKLGFCGKPVENSISCCVEVFIYVQKIIV